MKKFVIVLLAGAVVATFIAGCSKPQPMELKIKWQLGKRYTNQMSMEQVASMEVPGMSNAIEQASLIAQNFVVAPLKVQPNGVMDLQMEFTSTKMQTTMGNKLMSYFDSADDPKNDTNSPSAPIMRSIVGAQFGYEMDAAGKAGHVTGMDEFFAHVPAGDDKSRTMLHSMVNEELVQQLAMRGQGLPDKPVMLGDHWNMHLDENAGPAGILQMDMSYTFTGWEEHGGRKCVVIDFTGNVATKPGTGGGTGPMNVSVEKGTLVGKEWFDPALAMVVDTSSDQRMTLKISAQGKNINSQMRQNVSVRLLSVADAPR